MAFPKWNGDSVNSEILINHGNMHLSQFNDLLCYRCLTGSVVTSLSLTKKVMCSNNFFHKKIFIEFSQNINGKLDSVTSFQN